MIIQLLLTPIFALLSFLLSLLPTLPSMPDWISSLIQIVSYGLVVFPADVWVTVLSVIIFWRVALPGWAVIEWIYSKIPGVS